MRAARLLDAVLPTPSQTDLLRACLWPQPRDAEALSRWSAGVGDPVEALMSHGALRRRLAPLLRRPTLPGGGPLSIRVRAAEAYERQRSAAYDAAAAETLALLAPVCPVMLSRGQLLAVSAYPASHLRHRHDLDLLIPPGRLGDASQALAAGGFIPAEQRPGQHILTHPGGLPIVLHERALNFPGYDLNLWSGARQVQAYGQAIWRPSPEALLVHILLIAATAPSRASLLWAVDAWYALATDPPNGDRLLALLETAPLAAPALHWLVTALEAPVPGADDIGRLMAAASSEDVELALFAIRPTVQLRELLALTDNPRSRSAFWRWLLAPSTTALRRSGRIAPTDSSLGWRLKRPVSALARRLPQPGQPADDQRPLGRK